MLRHPRQPLALQEVAKLIVSSTCAKGCVKEGPGQRQHVLHCRPHGGRGSGAGEDGRWGRQARSLRRGRHTFTRTFTCPPRSRGGRASKPRCQRPRRRRAVDPDLGRQQAGNQAPISAGCLCKCHGSMGASQAAAGGPRSSGMMPWWPLRSLAHAARPGVVLGSTEGGHWLHVRARRSNKGSPSVDFVGAPDDVGGVHRLDGHLFALPHEQRIVQR